MKLKLGNSTKLEVTPHCPECGQKLDGATAIDCEATPKPGDITMCAYCCAFLTYTDDMALRLLTELEIYALDAHAKAVLIEMRKRMNKFRTNGRK